MKTAKAINIPFVSHEEITRAEVEPVIRPYLARLRAAAEEDAKLEAARDEASPDVAAEIFDKTYSAAVAGDAAAERRIYDMGPRERLVERQQQIYNIRETARHEASRRQAELFDEIGLALIPALTRAAQKAREQHNRILEVIGTPPAPPPQPGAKNAYGHVVPSVLEGLGNYCREGDGARGVIHRAGIGDIVFGEGK